MRLCIIDESGLCVNVIEADSEDSKFLQVGQDYAADHTGKVGDYYLGGQWRELKVEVTETITEIEARVRMQRDAILAACDWIVVKAYETGDPVPSTWTVYRQALRDITMQTGFPNEVVWPTKPE